MGRRFQRKDEAVIYEGHPFYDRPSITIEDLKGQPLVGLNEHFSLFHSLVRRCADFGFTPQFVVKTMESRLIYHSVRNASASAST